MLLCIFLKSEPDINCNSNRKGLWKWYNVPLRLQRECSKLYAFSVIVERIEILFSPVSFIETTCCFDTNRSIVTLLPWPAKMTFMSAAIFDWASLVGSGDESDMDSEVEDRVDGVKSLLSKSKGSAKTLSDEGTQKTTRSVWNPFSCILKFHFKDRSIYDPQSWRN